MSVSQKPARRVLIIEDNVDAAECLKDVLEFDQHVVAVALTGPEGLAKARTFLPDVVLCDIGLPGMDGYEVAQVLRSEDELQDIPLVAVTGYAGPEDRRKAENAGFDWHVKKPPCLDTLERILTDLPSRHTARKQS